MTAFTGYPVEEIMRVCVVSKASAEHFKRGSRVPSPQVQRLWWLHIRGRILGDEWQQFRAHGDSLVNSDGHEFTVEEIRTIPFLYQKIAELECELDRVRFTSDVSKLGFWDLDQAIDETIAHAERLKAALAKIPKRNSDRSSSCELNTGVR